MEDNKPMLMVAPMVDVTNILFRNFMRSITKRTQLWTEMTTEAFITADPDKALKFDPAEHPIVVQLGGKDPERLARCAEICESYGYDEINLNCGCPSDRVKGACFGACLMLQPEAVREACQTMIRRVSIPITVKCRIGVDNHDTYPELTHFINTVKDSGVKHFIIHARKAILSGLTPSQNRTIPPLRYDWVHNLIQDFPDLTFTINGGINTHEQIEEQLSQNVHGVMLGRAAYNNPWMFSSFDQRYYNEKPNSLNRKQVLEEYGTFCQHMLDKGETWSNAFMSKSVIHLFHSEKNNGAMKRYMNELVHDKKYKNKYDELIQDYISYISSVNEEILYSPPAYKVDNSL